MFQFYAKKFLVAFGDMERINMILRPHAKSDILNIDDTIRESVDGLCEHLSGLNLPVTLAAAKRLGTTVAGAEGKVQDILNGIDEVSGRLYDEIGPRLWLDLNGIEARYFSECPKIFGKDVTDKFVVEEDLAEAGKCYAVGRYTACVFHLMRAMEVAVQALCAKLGITNLDRVWGSLLSDMNNKIERLPKGTEREELAQLSALLYSLKEAWRNPTMHPKRTYTGEEAKEILDASVAFLRRLAQRV